MTPEARARALITRKRNTEARMAREDQQHADFREALALERDAYNRLRRVRAIDGDRPDEVALAHTEWQAALRLLHDIGLPPDGAFERARGEVITYVGS